MFTFGVAEGVVVGLELEYLVFEILFLVQQFLQVVLFDADGLQLDCVVALVVLGLDAVREDGDGRRNRTGVGALVQVCRLLRVFLWPVLHLLFVVECWALDAQFLPKVQDFVLEFDDDFAHLLRRLDDVGDWFVLHQLHSLRELQGLEAFVEVLLLSRRCADQRRLGISAQTFF